MALVRKRLRVLDDALDAMKTEFFTHQGNVVESRDVIDHRARLAAGTDLDEIVGLKRSKSAEDQPNKGGNVVVVNIQRAAEPVTVIEAEPNTGKDSAQ